MNITGLTSEQKSMMDFMWSLPTRKDLVRWRNNLSPQDRIMSESLEYLMVVEFIDDLDDNDYFLADEVIEKVKNK